MKSLLARSLRYYQVPGKPFLGFTENLLHDKAFRFWSDFWTGILKANGTSEKPNPDDFFRQDVVGVFEHQGEVVALHGQCFFDLSLVGTAQQSYFKRFFTADSLGALEKSGARRVMSMEMYSVLPDWRSPKLGVSLAAILTGLALRLVKEWKVDAGIGIARVDLGVDKMVQNQGAILLGPEVQIYNTPCRQIAFFPDRIHPHANAQVNDHVEYFWRNRFDATERSVSTGKTRKAA